MKLKHAGEIEELVTFGIFFDGTYIDGFLCRPNKERLIEGVQVSLTQQAPFHFSDIQLTGVYLTNTTAFNILTFLYRGRRRSRRLSSGDWNHRTSHQKDEVHKKGGHVSRSTQWAEGPASIGQTYQWNKQEIWLPSGHVCRLTMISHEQYSILNLWFQPRWYGRCCQWYYSCWLSPNR